MPLKRYLWLIHVGEIPKGYVIRYKDGNAKRCIISNLECITRGENGKRNIDNTDREKYEKVKAFFRTEKGKEVAKARGKKSLEWWKTQGKERRLMLCNAGKKVRETNPDAYLTDKVITYFLTVCRSDIRAEVSKDKDLIELKRTQIKLKRLCKALQQNQDVK